jgi:hypothetical protein
MAMTMAERGYGTAGGFPIGGCVVRCCSLPPVSCLVPGASAERTYSYTYTGESEERNSVYKFISGYPPDSPARYGMIPARHPPPMAHPHPPVHTPNSSIHMRVLIHESRISVSIVSFLCRKRQAVAMDNNWLRLGLYSFLVIM